MKKMDMTRKIVIVIGLISLIVGVYVALTGGEFGEYLFSFVIGSSLIGSTFFGTSTSNKDKCIS